MPLLRMGQVVVTEGAPGKLVSEGIMRFTGSRASHVFVSTAKGWAVEAKFPRARRFKADDRLAQMIREDRAYAILDLPSLTIEKRIAIAATAEQQVGKWYDVGQIAAFVFTGHFYKDGPGTVVCSRLVTHVFTANKESLFDGEVLDHWYPVGNPRRGDVASQFATPDDLLHSRLVLQEFQPSSRVKTVEDFFKRS